MTKQAQQDQRINYYWTRVQQYGPRYRNFSWPPVEALLNLLYTTGLLEGQLSKWASRYKLSRAGVNVLNILSRSETKGCKHHEISKLLLVSRANVTGLIDSLIRHGLVERTLDPHDRRVCIAKITPKGEKALEKILPEYFANIDRIFSVLSAAEKKTFNRLLCKVREAIGQFEEEK